VEALNTRQPRRFHVRTTDGPSNAREIVLIRKRLHGDEVVCHVSPVVPANLTGGRRLAPRDYLLPANGVDIATPDGLVEAEQTCLLLKNLIDDNLDGPVGSTSASYGILVLVGRPYQ